MVQNYSSPINGNFVGPNGEIHNLLELFIGTGGGDSSMAFIVLSFSIAPSNWLSSAIYTDYIFQADFINSNIRSSDSVQIILSPDSVIEANAIGILDGVAVENGYSRLFAKSVPQRNLLGTLIIFRDETLLNGYGSVNVSSISSVGSSGKSAYEIAVENGFVGTEQE